jgi:isoleucyl-tRNA synthetase
MTAAHRAALEGLDLAEIAITSGIEVVEGAPAEGAFTLPDVPGIGVVPVPAQGEKCERCWRVLAEVGREAEHPSLCLRCADAVSTLPAVEG